MAFRLWLVGVLTLGSGAGCADEVGPARSAVLVTLDATRADALGCHGGPEPASTPNLDLLAVRGVRYEQARTVAPLSRPAHASILTGHYPPRHGVRTEVSGRLDDRAVTVAELAREAGFQTAAFVGSGRLDETSGFAQGFEVYAAPDGKDRSVEGGARPAGAVVAQALGWLEGRDRGRSFFLWIHLGDADLDLPGPLGGQPLRMPGRVIGASPRSAYLEEVERIDAALGELFAALDTKELEDRCFLAVAGVHGESFGEHGEPRHGLGLWDTTLRVPLLLGYRDGYGAGEVSGEVVSVVDLAPTLLDAMELETDRELQGKSLYYQSIESDRGVYFESYEGWRRFGWSPLVGFADARGKYVLGAREALFDLRRDPGETTTVVPADGLPERYREGIRAVHAATPPYERPGASGAVDPRVLADLAELGYALPERPDTAFPLPDQLDVPDTRDRLADYIVFEQARARLESGGYEAALPSLLGLRQLYPDSVAILDALGTALIEAQDHALAVEVLRSRLRLPPEAVATHRDLRVCFTALGDEARALRHSIRALELQVELHQARRDAESLRAARRLLDQARRSAAETLASDPDRSQDGGPRTP